MGKWLTNLFGGGAGKLAESVGGVVEKIQAGHLSKREADLELKRISAEVLSELQDETIKEIESRERILVAELQQDDKWTKRARPAIIYTGLAAFGLDIIVRYVAHFTGNALPETLISPVFWDAWKLVVGVYGVGRSAEKIGAKGKLVGWITGNGGGSGSK